VICRAVLEHIPENDIPQVLREIRRVSNRGLYMIAIIADENRPELYEFWRKEDPSHITLKTFDWWKKRFEESGLQVTFYDGALQLIASRQQ